MGLTLYGYYAVPTIYNSGDISWILTSTALTRLMIPGVGTFYSSLLRRRKALPFIYLYLAVLTVGRLGVRNFSISIQLPINEVLISVVLPGLFPHPQRERQRIYQRPQALRSQGGRRPTTRRFLPYSCTSVLHLRAHVRRHYVRVTRDSTSSVI